MTLPTETQLKTLPCEELIVVATELLATVKLSQARVTELEAELAKVRHLPATSRNSSLPPSRDWKAKTGMSDGCLKPLFIFSLQRSGSTLLQRMLTALPGISSHSEPWVLLPYLSVLRNEKLVSVTSAYGAELGRQALDDFAATLPGGRAEYLEALREFIIDLYKRSASDNTIYFLDKTPRYYFIASDVLDLFPDAKAICLFRNPLALAASTIETQGQGRWNLFFHHTDLVDGIEALVDTLRQYSARVHAVRYEDLVTRPEPVLEGVFHYLEMEPDFDVVRRFVDLRFNGSMGDQIGVKQYNGYVCTNG
jgi:hypothetical protein